MIFILPVAAAITCQLPSPSLHPLFFIIFHSSYPDWTSDEGEDSADFASMANTAADILHLLSSLTDCEEVLTQLLQEKNLEGYTPFMAAVAYKVRHVIRCNSVVGIQECSSPVVSFLFAKL